MAQWEKGNIDDMIDEEAALKGLEEHLASENSILEEVNGMTMDEYLSKLALHQEQYWEEYDKADKERIGQEWSEHLKEAAIERAEDETRRIKEEAKLRRNGEILIDTSGDDLSLNEDMW